MRAPGRLTAVLAIVLCASPPLAESTASRLQIEDEGLAIYGTVMRPGTREPVATAQVEINGRNFDARVAADAEGRFRVTRLEPGEYRLTPVPPESADERSRTSIRTETVRISRGELPPDLVLWLPQTSRISGRVTDPDGEPLPDMEVSLWRMGWSGQQTLVMAMDTLRGPRTDEDGRYELHAPPGEYYVEARDRFANTYPRHYYPGVLYPEEAGPVTLHAGTDLTGIDITLGDARLYRVRFSLDPPLLPGMTEPTSAYLAEGAVLLGAIIRPVGLGQIEMGRLPYGIGLRPVDDETWEFGQLLGPGEYDLSIGYNARALLDQLRPRGFDPALHRRAFRIVGTRITVNPDDADEMGHIDLGTIPVTPKVSVEGRVVVRPLERGSIDMTRLSTTLGGWNIAADGTFVLEDRMPGRYTFRFHLTSIPEGWYVESIRSGGRDVLRDGLDLTGRPDPIQVVIAEGTAEIAGTARDVDGGLIPGARIVLIPPPGKRGWQARFPTAVASASGRYVLGPIPPGDYRLLALDEAGTVVPVPGPLPADLYWEDPGFLREYELRGERITVDPGARMTIDAAAIPISE